MSRTLALAVAFVVGWAGSLPSAGLAGASVQEARFRAGVDLVSVSAVVRDGRGRLVRDLGSADLLVFDGGEAREIRDFRVDEGAAIRVALLVDGSGSMRVGTRLEDAKRAAGTVLRRLVFDGPEQALDAAAVFRFDTGLDELVDFSSDVSRLDEAVATIEAYGQTSLYDAIAATARRVGDGPAARTAIIVLTDGIDTASRLGAPDVSGLASAIDVPVYVMAIVARVDRSGEELAEREARETPRGTLANLAWWTGGEFFLVSSEVEVEEAARRLLAELRHQYVIAFESAAEPGWRPLDIRARDPRLTVRTRSGYFAGQTRPVGSSRGG